MFIPCGEIEVARVLLHGVADCIRGGSSHLPEAIGSREDAIVDEEEGED